MAKIIVAIDGYSSCGKSTMAKQMAKELNYIYIDTGAMYRAVTLYAVRNSLILNDELNTEGLVKALDQINVSFTFNTNTNKSETCLNGENVEQEIRGIEVSNHVSKIAQVKEVRAKMVDMQRAMGQDKGLVMDGRDIGTVVFPNAELKIFMTADYQIRAKRRFDELRSKGDNLTSYEDVEANINSRDMDDTSRKENPLIQAKDALVIDNSNISRAEQLKIALDAANAKIDS
jgi:cytidylate kinase